MEFTGERYCPQIKGEIALEHYLRYVLATSLAEGKDVLDIASGEGYGSFLLSGKAKSVVGVDISREAVEHAGASYVAENLRYMQGDATQIPLPDASVDMVVSFETIEHHDRHEEMLDEIRRVLRPGGLLMLSSPERAVNEDLCGHNPYHVKELYRSELEDLIGKRFAHVAFWGQRSVFASMLTGEGASGIRIWPPDAVMDFEAGTADLSHPKFYVVLASDCAELPSLPFCVMEGSVQESLPYTLLEKNAARRESDMLRYQDELKGVLEEQRQALEEQGQALEEQGRALEEQRQALEEQQQAFRSLEKAYHDGETLIAEMINSRSWKLTAPLRAGGALYRRWRRKFFFLRAMMGDIPSRLRRKLGRLPVRRRIVLLSGEAHTPGHVYRMRRLLEALRTRYDAELFSVTDLEAGGALARSADLLWIWRAQATPLLDAVVEAVHARGGKVIFDIDDLCFHPSYYVEEYMDTIRHRKLDTTELRQSGERMFSLVMRADFCVGATPPLAQELFYKTGKSAAVIRNTFDHVCRIRCLKERAQFLREKKDDLLRIGYAAGTITHQADFSVAAPALRRILQKYDNVRLVLFRTIDLSETDIFHGMEQSIEWREIVPLEDLPHELARFDINIIPLETDNIFCHCKSELKFFEAALAGIPSVASATRPFCDAVADGETGFLARNAQDWDTALERLVQDEELRRRMGRAARRAVLWRFGPEYLRHAASSLIEYILGNAEQRAHVFAVEELCRQQDLERGGNAIAVPDYDVIFSTGPACSKVSVIIPLYNYENFVVEALNSLLEQTLSEFDVIVVNDCSTDNSQEVAEEWLKEHRQRFSSVSLLRNGKNSGLSMTRNAGVDFADTEFVMLLDADNMLLPRCLEECARLLDAGEQAFVFPKTEVFGDDSRALVSCGEWDPAHLRYGNYIDAMTMVKRSHWAAVGGYTVQNLGWEDYDFWCKLVDRGFYGINTEDILARYRVHPQSMLHQITDKEKSRESIKAAMRKRHPWMEF